MTDSALECMHALDVLTADPSTVSTHEIRRARVHAATCPDCDRIARDPDAPDRVLTGLDTARLDPPMPLRVSIAVVAIVQLVFAIPWLFGVTLLPDRYVAVSHLTRDGALGLVIATAGILVAWRPRYAVSAVVVGAIVLTAQATLGVVDQQNQSVNTVFELLHLLVLCILAMIAIASTTTRRSAPATRQTQRRLHSL